MRLGRNLVDLQRVEDEGLDAVALELRGGEVDRDAAIGGKQLAVARRLPDHPFADRNDEPRLLGDRNEDGGGHESLAREPPSEHCLVADDPAGRELHLRLIDELEVIVLQRMAEPVFERAPARQVLRHLRIEEPPGAAALALGAVEREIGVAHQRLEVGAVIGSDRESDRAADLDFVAVDAEGTGEQVQHALGERRQHGGVGDPRHHDGEFVAGEPGEEVAAAKRRLEPLAAGLQEPVADRVTERVVDRLEAIEVEHEERRLVPLLFDPGKRFRHEFLEPLAVRQSGQLVVQREVADGGVLCGELPLPVAEAGHEGDEGDERDAAAEHDLAREGGDQGGDGRGLVDAQCEPRCARPLGRKDHPAMEWAVAEPAYRIERVGAAFGRIERLGRAGGAGDDLGEFGARVVRPAGRSGRRSEGMRRSRSMPAMWSVLFRVSGLAACSVASRSP